MFIVLLGRPGSGKSTLAKHLKKKYSNIAYISSGDIARSLADSTEKEQLKSGEMFTEDKMRNEINRRIYDALYDKKDVILDGFPRTLDQMKWLDKMFECDKKIITLDCARKKCIERLHDRKREDDLDDTILKRIEMFDKFSMDIYDYDGNTKYYVNANYSAFRVMGLVETILRYK